MLELKRNYGGGSGVLSEKTYRYFFPTTLVLLDFSMPPPGHLWSHDYGHARYQIPPPPPLKKTKNGVTIFFFRFYPGLPR